MATRVFGILGHPLHHTLSPAMHAAAFDALGLDALYAPFDVPPRQLTRVILGLHAAGIDGLNVTVPHKEAVLRWLGPRRVSREAAAVGAVNTLVRDGRELRGENTDVEGFRQALVEDLGVDAAGKTALILGAGGAARAVVWALLRDRIAMLHIANRTIGRAQALARWFRRAAPGAAIRAIPLRAASLRPVVDSVDLVVNATSLGLRTTDPLPIDPRLITKRSVVADLVYRAPTTALVQALRRRGVLAIDGVAMLVYQGAAAFQLWWGRPAPVDAMRRAVERAVRAREVRVKQPEH